MFKTKLNEVQSGLTLLLLRLLSGGLMMNHGWGKFQKIAELKTTFPDPLGVGHEVSYFLTLFAELLCAGLLVLGLFTRLALIPLLILMAVAVFKIHGGDPLQEKELAIFYLVIYAALMISGPGQYSADRMIFKK